MFIGYTYLKERHFFQVFTQLSLEPTKDPACCHEYSLFNNSQNLRNCLGFHKILLVHLRSHLNLHLRSHLILPVHLHSHLILPVHLRSHLLLLVHLRSHLILLAHPRNHLSLLVHLHCHLILLVHFRNHQILLAHPRNHLILVDSHDHPIYAVFGQVRHKDDFYFLQIRRFRNRHYLLCNHHIHRWDIHRHPNRKLDHNHHHSNHFGHLGIHLDNVENLSYEPALLLGIRVRNLLQVWAFWHKLVFHQEYIQLVHLAFHVYVAYVRKQEFHLECIQLAVVLAPASFVSRNEPRDPISHLQDLPVHLQVSVSLDDDVSCVGVYVDKLECHQAILQLVLLGFRYVAFYAVFCVVCEDEQVFHQEYNQWALQDVHRLAYHACHEVCGVVWLDKLEFHQEYIQWVLQDVHHEVYHACHEVCGVVWLDKLEFHQEYIQRVLQDVHLEVYHACHEVCGVVWMDKLEFHQEYIQRVLQDVHHEVYHACHEVCGVVWLDKLEFHQEYIQWVLQDVHREVYHACHEVCGVVWMDKLEFHQEYIQWALQDVHRLAYHACHEVCGVVWLDKLEFHQEYIQRVLQDVHHEVYHAFHVVLLDKLEFHPEYIQWVLQDVHHEVYHAFHVVCDVVLLDKLEFHQEYIQWVHLDAHLGPVGTPIGFFSGCFCPPVGISPYGSSLGILDFGSSFGILGTVVISAEVCWTVSVVVNSVSSTRNSMSSSVCLCTFGFLGIRNILLDFLDVWDDVVFHLDQLLLDIRSIRLDFLDVWDDVVFHLDQVHLQEHLRIERFLAARHHSNNLRDFLVFLWFPHRLYGVNKIAPSNKTVLAVIEKFRCTGLVLRQWMATTACLKTFPTGVAVPKAKDVYMGSMLKESNFQ
ncbi:hypothetical protein C0J52_24641 [Blattella germanica]|nr:hypothetical protein C0J52_24641 [Blattella germanica]